MSNNIFHISTMGTTIFEWASFTIILITNRCQISKIILILRSNCKIIICHFFILISFFKSNVDHITVICEVVITSLQDHK